MVRFMASLQWSSRIRAACLTRMPNPCGGPRSRTVVTKYLRCSSTAADYVLCFPQEPDFPALELTISLYVYRESPTQRPDDHPQPCPLCRGPERWFLGGSQSCPR